MLPFQLTPKMDEPSAEIAVDIFGLDTIKVVEARV